MADQNSGGTYVVRRPGARSTFQRSVQNEKGEVVDLLVFEPEQPVELNQQQMTAVKSDLGGALAIVEPDKSRPGRFNVDWDRTYKVFRDEHDGREPPNQGKRRANVGTGKRVPKTEPTSEAGAIRAYLKANPKAENQEVVDALGKDGIKINSSQVSRERKAD